MYNRPLVLGVGARRPLDLDRNLDLILQDVGTNTGNMLFAEAAFRHLAGARRAGYEFDDSDVEDRDCIVMTAANWLMPYDDSSDLLRRIEATSLPVFILGIGAQSGKDLAIPQIPPDTLRLMRVIADRSTSLAARGSFTAEVLFHYGIKNVEVTGCPSLLMAGNSGITLNYPDEISWSETVLHGTRHLHYGSEPTQRHIYRQAMKHRARLILQSELSDMHFALGVAPDSDAESQTIRDRLGQEYSSQLGPVSRYLRSHAKVFFDLDSWLQFLRGKHLCLGSRIHGTVAGLLAGVPSLLIAHDSRTVELAETMRLPFVTDAEVDLGADFAPSELVNRDALAQCAQYYSTYRSNFRDYFRRNGLRWSDDPLPNAD